MTEPTVDELCITLIAWARDHGSGADGGWAVHRFERWIQEEPERGWEVLRQLVARAPQDADVMKLAAFRVPLFLQRDFQRYRDRVLALLDSSSCLDAFIGPEVFVEAEYAPQRIEPERLAQLWLRNSRWGDSPRWKDHVDHAEPDVRLRLAFEIVERGP